MATPGELVKCIAEALNIPEPTVIQYDRLLAENGLRSKGGRGPSAAKVTAEDAANLLIAILGAPVAGASIKPAIETCRTYGQLRLRLVNGDFIRLGFPTLAKLPKSHTLRDGIAASIEAAKAGESYIYPPDEGDPEPSSGPQNDRVCSIQFSGPEPWAGITLGFLWGNDESEIDLHARLVYHGLKRGPHGRWVKHRGTGDLREDRFITFKTIRRIGELLAKDGKQ